MKSMRLQFWCVIWCATLCVMSLAHAGPARDYTHKSFDALIEELLTYNPELQALVAEIDAARARSKHVGMPDDPRVSFEASNIPVDNASMQRTPMSGYQLYLRQRIPFPGKLRTKKRIAQAQAEQQAQAHLEKLNQLVAKFKARLFDYAYAHKAIGITNQSLRRLQALTGTLEARYAAGAVPQQDVLATKVESSKLREQLLALQNQRATLAAELTSLLARPAGTRLHVAIPSTRATPVRYGLDELQAIAQDRPWLTRAEHGIEAAQQAHTLAKKGLLPDFDFSVGYRIRDTGLSEPINGANFFSTGVSMNIPLWSFRKQRQQIAEARHRSRAAQQEHAALSDEVQFQVESLYRQAEQLRQQHQLFVGRILPERRAALRSAQKSYEAGEIDYYNVIAHELDLFRDQLTTHQHFYARERTIAELEMAIGQRLDHTSKGMQP